MERNPRETVRRAEIVEALSHADAHPPGAGEVSVRREPRLTAFVTRERVVELRTDGDAPASVEERRGLAEEEVRLERRLTPDLQLGPVPATREPDGRIVLDGRGPVVDWLVARKRIPEERSLGELLDRRAVDDRDLWRLAKVLARFHDRSMTGPNVNEQGLPRVVAQGVRQSTRRLTELLGRESASYLERRVDAALTERRELLELRIARWRIRDGHGDLRAERVFYVGDALFVLGTVVGDRRRRCGDVARDLAGLVVDLDLRGAPDIAGRLVELYAQVADDAEVPVLVREYRLHRALARAADELGAADEAARRRALRTAHLGLHYALGPALVLVAGVDAGAVRVADYLAGCARTTARRSAGSEDDPSTEVVRALERGRSAVAVLDPGDERGRERLIDAAVRLGSPAYALGADEVGAARSLAVDLERPPEEVAAELLRRRVADAAQEPLREPAFDLLPMP